MGAGGSTTFTHAYVPMWAGVPGRPEGRVAMLKLPLSSVVSICGCRLEPKMEVQVVRSFFVATSRLPEIAVATCADSETSDTKCPGDMVVPISARRAAGLNSSRGGRLFTRTCSGVTAGEATS